MKMKMNMEKGGTRSKVTIPEVFYHKGDTTIKPPTEFPSLEKFQDDNEDERKVGTTDDVEGPFPCKVDVHWKCKPAEHSQ